VRATPYRFSPEQLGRLDAHFGAREVWLPMELDELVAALVEAQALEMELPVGYTARFISANLRVLPKDDTEKEEDMSPAAIKLTALSAQLIEDVKKAFPGVELTQKKAYVRAHLGRVTVGYLYPSPNGGKSAVETPIGDGKYAYQTITNAAELKKAIAAMKAVEKRAAKKAASKAKAK
jgi:hypothetical protein